MTIGIQQPLSGAGADGLGPVSISLEQLQAMCASEERTLRMQSPPDGDLGGEAEARLKRIDASTIVGALRRWAYIKHLYLSRMEGLSRQEDRAIAEDAARALLRREPVRVRIGPYHVNVTARSYSAMLEIAQHAVRARELQADIVRCEEIEDQLLVSLRATRRKRRVRRRMRWVAAIHRRLLVESLLHRRAIYAHALTPSGAPAASLEEAPPWVEEIDPAWDALLISAVHEAGPGRYMRLGEEPEPPKGAKKDERESFGWHSFFAAIERNAKIPAAQLYDRDLYQYLTWVRAGSPGAEPTELE